MLRRVITHLLVIPLLASPGFCPSHAHGGDEAPDATGCAARPHIHLSGGHLHGGHVHRDGTKHDCGHDEATDEVELTVCRDCGQHDDDAVYLPDSVGYGVTRKISLDGSGQPVVPLMASAATVVDLDVARLARDVSPSVASVEFHCALYLRTLSLRI